MSDRTIAGRAEPAGLPTGLPTLAAGAALVGCCVLAASTGRPGDLTVRPESMAGARIDVADLLQRVPSWITLVVASVTSTVLLLVTIPLLLLALRALWRLLLQLAGSARRPAARSRRGRVAVRRAAPPSTGTGTTGAEGADRARLRASLAAPAAQAAESLRDHGDRVAGDEVIRAWEAVERVAAASGAPRRPGDTPAEFTHAVLQSLRVDADALGTLLEVYRRARFSRRPLTPAEVDRARAAFAVVAGQLRTGAGAAG